MEKNMKTLIPPDVVASVRVEGSVHWIFVDHPHEFWEKSHRFLSHYRMTNDSHVYG